MLSRVTKVKGIKPMWIKYNLGGISNPAVF